MAFYTKLKKKDIKKIEKFIHKRVIKVEGIKEGSVNSNYLIKSKKKKYILTILEKKKEKIKETIKLINYLNIIFNFIPKYYKYKEKYFFYIKKKKSVLSEYKKGKKIKIAKKKESFEIGKFLSMMHIKSNNLKIFKKNNFNYISLRKKIIFIKRFLNRKQIFFIEKIYRINKKFILSKKYQKLPISICHCDLFKDNVFFKNKIIAILDFHFSCFEKRLYDISIHINEWCFKKRINFKKVKYFLIGYFKYNKIKKKEFNCIYNFMLITSFRFLITRLENFFQKKKKKSVKYYFQMINYYIKNKNEIINNLGLLYEYTNKFFIKRNN
ncbi:phosphotransferase [Candidatus Vidania fulgoroideorum]